ncbi:FimV/HubP family polar landmark protein [Pseudomonas segetis]|uniref:Pilus assembly protein FimV n=1 Tax=Pseudomonas segetis TaxID=298908 RepID=A0A239A4H0_9PSED|nr:FimV/HubP family polar landmark protein [Pseudomonas segetis]SNR89803.1 pilus assembly protein FimV [Pseudomonas segetis]
MSRVRHVLIGLASSSALYSSFAPALGLGEITLHSALNQPLEADIQLLQVGDLSANEIKVKLASAEAFSRSGVERFVFLNDLSFTPVLSNGRSIVRVTSRQAVREPYLNFIVEVSRPNGQLLREYTVLLDPPITSIYGSASPAPSSQYSTRSTSTVAAAPAQPVRPTPPKVMPAATLGQAHQVRSGDTLWQIASQLRDQGSNASQQSLMNDIYALNPQAFANGDINRLKAGVDLRLPDSAVNTSQAGSSPNSNSNQRAISASQDDAASGQPSSAGSAEVAPAVVGDRADAQALAEIQQRLDLELANQSNLSLQLQQSISQLQAQVQALQTQVEAKDQRLAELQSQLDAGPAPQTSGQPQVTAPAPVEPVEQPTDWMPYLYGLLALLLAGLLALLWRSKRERTPAPEAPAIAVASVEKPQEPLFQPVALNAQAPVTEPAPAPAPAPAASRQKLPVDAIEAANIYITYGRYPEAVSALRKALQAHPERHDIRFRLLEVLALQGDAQHYQAEEALLRQSSFAPERIDQLNARYPQLHGEELDFDALELDEPADLAPAPSPADDYQLNLDDLSLDADWDLVSPFSPKTKAKPATPEQVDIDTNLRDLPSLEELPHDDDEFAALTAENDAALGAWFEDDPRSPANLNNLSDFDTNASNMLKLNQALAYIEQGSIESACDILNEVLNDGDDKQKQEARKLLAKIA